MDLETKRKRIELGIKLLALPVIGFFIAPFIFVAIKGIIGLAISGVVSLVLINLTPWFGAKVANWRLKALKHEAAQNPIETLQNEYKSRMEALQRFRDYIRSFAGEVQTFQGKLGEFKERYPRDAAQFDEKYKQMRLLLESRKTKYEAAKGNLEQFEGEIQKATAIWDMAQAAAQMNKAAGVDTEEFFAKIQVETALDSVQKSLNTAFADLEVSLLDEKKLPPAVSAPAQPTAIPEKSGPPNLELEIGTMERTPTR